MMTRIFNTTFNAMAGLWQAWIQQRQYWLNRLFSALYDRPMVVAPAHVVGLAGVAVLWVWQGSQRQLLMVRPKDGTDARGRFVSCLGLGQNPDMAAALTKTLELQLGTVFTSLLPIRALAPDAVAAAPMLTMTDEDSGAQLPMQVLAWVAEIRPNQLETLELAPNLELVMVTENAVGSPQVSPTHRLLWQTVQRHVPQRKASKAREDSVVMVDEDSRVGDDSSARKGGRILH